MKKIIIILFCFQSVLFSQGGWEVIYSGNYSYGPFFKDISFFNENTGWVLTASDVRKTTNTGQSWTKYQFPNSYNYMICYHFLNNEIGWVINENFLEYTSNSGNSWTRLNTLSAEVKDLYFLDNNTGWFCGRNGIIMKTTDGGVTWLNQNSGTANHLNSIAFADNAFGVCGGDWGKILWTTNGGSSWQQFTDVYMGFFTDLKFPDNMTCVVTGNGSIIYRTTNRGAEWHTYFTNYSIQNTVKFPSVNTGYIFGSPFAFLKTTNKGDNWHTITANGLSSQVFGLSVTPSNKYWCAADSGIIFKSTDNGYNWNIAYREYITKENLKSVYFVNQSTGIAAGNHGVLLNTTNSGINWDYRNLGTDNTLNSIQFVNSETGFIAGASGYSFGVVYKTTNSGSTWEQVYLDSMQLNSVHFINPSTGWCADNYRAIIKTTNAGSSWVKFAIITSPPLNFIYDLFFINENTGFIGGNGMYKTTNGGLNWYRVLIYTIQTIQFVGNTGFAITSVSGNFMKSTNTGENWTSYPTGGSYRGDLFFINTETGWLNTPSVIRKTTNGGINWTVQNTDSNSIPAKSIFFLNENYGWVVGDYGSIMRTTNGGIGITQISSEIPVKHYLYQNYPNPFNPVTKIRFQIPPLNLPFIGEDNGGVVLKIYDILGKEIAVLVNEELSPGTYEVNWDASNNSSGVYFYSLISDSFIQTRKMVLIK